MAAAGHYVMSEEDRVQMRSLKCKQEAMELFISGGSNQVNEVVAREYEKVLNEVNEIKRRLLEESGNLDEDMFDYTYYFDTVAGYIWIEDAE